jgi:hypothetical protein
MVYNRTSNTDGLGNSALFFPSNVSCHSLYDFLLNWVDPKVEVRARGPPKLVASCPFLNATMTCASVSKPTLVRQGTAKQSIWKLTIKGTILPDHLQFFLNHVAEKNDFECAFETLPLSCIQNGTELEHKSIQSLSHQNGAFLLKYIA